MAAAAATGGLDFGGTADKPCRSERHDGRTDGRTINVKRRCAVRSVLFSHLIAISIQTLCRRFRLQEVTGLRYPPRNCRRYWLAILRLKMSENCRNRTTGRVPYTLKRSLMEEKSLNLPISEILIPRPCSSPAPFPSVSGKF